MGLDVDPGEGEPFKGVERRERRCSQGHLGSKGTEPLTSECMQRLPR